MLVHTCGGLKTKNMAKINENQEQKEGKTYIINNVVLNDEVLAALAYMYSAHSVKEMREWIAETVMSFAELKEMERPDTNFTYSVNMYYKLLKAMEPLEAKQQEVVQASYPD